MQTPLRLFIDTDGRSLVQSEKRSDAYTLPEFVQGDTVQLEVVLLRRGSGYNSGIATATAPVFNVINNSSLSLKVAIGTPNPATSATPTIYQNTFSATYVDGIYKFTGELEIGAGAATTLLNGNVTGSFTFEVEVGEAGKYSTVLYSPCTLRAELIEGSAGNPPVPADSYMTAAESRNTFVKRIGAAGEAILLTSPDGTKQGLIYWGDDGSFHAEPVS